MAAFPAEDAAATFTRQGSATSQAPSASPEARDPRGLEELSELFLGRRDLGRNEDPGRSGTPHAAAPVAGDMFALRAAAALLAADPAGCEAALQAALNGMGEAAGAAATRLYLLDAQGTLRLCAGQGGWEGLPFLALVLRLEAGTLERAVRSREPLLLRESFEVSGPPEFATRAEASCLALPLSVRGQVRGLCLLFKEEPFGEALLASLQESAAGLALVLDYLELLSATLKSRPRA